MEKNIAVQAECAECGRRWLGQQLSSLILTDYWQHVTVEHGGLTLRRSA
jgi:hypothetical protein